MMDDDYELGPNGEIDADAENANDNSRQRNFITVGSILVSKREYAVGLQWNSIEDLTKSLKEARAFASLPAVQADFVATRDGNSPQFAVGFKAYGHKEGQPSLAAHLADTNQGSWVGLFEVSNGYYLIAIKDGAILSEYERFISDLDAAIEQFDNLRDLHWDVVYAPATVASGDEQTRSLEDLLRGKPKCKLKSANGSSTRTKIYLLGILVVLGGYIANTYLLNDSDEALLDSLNSIALNNPIVNAEPPPPPPPMPWAGKAHGAAFLTECVNDILAMKVVIPGWSINELYCSQSTGTAAAAVDRDGTVEDAGGALAWIAPAIAREGFKPTITPPPDGSGSRARIEWKLNTVPAYPDELKTAKLHKIREAFIAVFENRREAVRLSTGVQDQYSKELIFEFTTPDDPLRFNDLLSEIPSLIIDDVKFTVSNNVWTVKGMAYEKLPAPVAPQQR